MTSRTTTTWLFATVFLTATRALEMWLSARVTGDAVAVSSSGWIASLVAAEGIHAAVIVWLAARSAIPDPTRLLALIGIGLGFVIANNVEAAVFDIAPIAPLLGVGVLAVASHALAVFGIAKRVPPGGAALSLPPFRGRSTVGLITRVALLGFVYAIAYFIAGAIIYPFVREFYQARSLPDTKLVFALQALFRGPLFAIIGLLVVATHQSTRMANAFAVAVTLAGLGGLTALLAPNPLFPDAVRFVHLAEVGTSNFVFGWIVGWMLTDVRAGHDTATPAVTSKITLRE